MISRDSIDKVIETAQTEEVVGQYVNLKRRGVNLIGLCPFHDEKTPSFTVSPSKNIYKCFGCGKGGGAVNFLMDHEGFSFPETIRFLANMYNIELEETAESPEEAQKALKKDSLFIINEYAKNHFIHNLFNTQSGVAIGLSYFKERGFREKTIRDFGLGFAPDEYADLTTASVQKNYKQEFLIELGLSSKNGRDFFRNRVIFPIHNLSGKAIGFGGRALSNDKKIPKYINSIESDIYNKRKTLYGMYFAKNAIRKEDACILVEGYTDVISLHQAGIENVVASSGTALTTDQIKLIRRYTQNVIVLYDGDEAGINAAMRGLDLILSENMFIKLAVLPEKHDPDSYLREVGPSNFLEFLDEKSDDFILFKSRLLEKDSKNDPVAKVRVLKDIVQTIAKVPDPLARSTYIKECSRILDIEERILVSESNKLIKNEIRQRNFRERVGEMNEGDLEVLDKFDKSKSGTQQKYTGRTDQQYEKELFRLIITNGDKYYDEEKGILIIDYLIDECGDLIQYFEDDWIRKHLDEIIENKKEGKILVLADFLNHQDSSVQQYTIDLISNPYTYSDWSSKGMELQTQKLPEENFKMEAEEIALRLNYRKINKIIEENWKRLENTDPGSDDYLIIIKIHQRLKEEQSKLARILNNVIS